MQLNIMTLGKSYLKSYSGLSRMAWYGILLNLFESAFIGTFYFLTIYFIDDLKLSIALAGSIISFYGIGAIIGGYLGGILSDKFSPKVVMTVSLVIAALSYLFLIKIIDTQLLFVNVFILGIAGYGFITANQLWVLHECGSSGRIKALNLLASASNLGLGISGLLIGAFSHIGFHNIFFISGGFLLLLACSAIYVKSGEARNDLATDDKRKDIAEHENYLNKRTVIWFVLTTVFFVGTIVSQLSASYPIYIREAYPQYGIQGISILFALNSFMVVLIATPVGDFISRFNKLLMVGVGGALIGFGMFLLIFSNTFAFAVISCVVYTFGETIYFCMAQYICYQKSANNKKGRGLGLYRVFYASSRVVGPAAGGLIYHSFGGQMIWYISGVIGLVTLLGSSLYRK